MSEIIALVLLFLAVAWGTWVISPLLVEVGLERIDGQYVKTRDPSFDPMYRFTTPHRLMQSCCAAALLGGGLAGAILIAAGILESYVLLIAPPLIGTVAFQIPRLWLQRRIKQRNLLFQTRLMDLTLGLASGLRAGAALPQSLEVVARDIGGPVGEECNLLLREYHLGVDLQEGLVRLTRRMPGEDLLLLVTAVRLTMQSGGSLAEVLDKITDTIRQRTEFHEKLKTMTAQGKFEAISMAAAPVAAFALLFFIDSELMKPLVTTHVGWCAIGVAVVLETIGFLIISKIVDVEV